MDEELFNATHVKAQAAALGFNLVGITPAQPSPHLNEYLAWIEAGMHGTMGYLARPDRIVRRENLHVILPEVRSMVLVGLDYQSLGVPASIVRDPLRGRIASYAWGADYHNLMLGRLEALAAWLSAQSSSPVRHRAYVDTGAILERSHAQQAGMGFTGKNTLLINPRRGSYFFLGEILTTAAFDPYDTPHRETMCGSCNRCQSACPTAAFPGPYVLDARRCISYLTIEHKHSIDESLRPLFGNWVYGCDVCQEVCPWQRFAMHTQTAEFIPQDLDRVAPLLRDLLTLTEESFRERFAGSAIERIKRDRLVRNACIAAGNAADPELHSSLMPLLDDPNELVREHAAWAVEQLRQRH